MRSGRASNINLKCGAFENTQRSFLRSNRHFPIGNASEYHRRPGKKVIFRDEPRARLDANSDCKPLTEIVAKADPGKLNWPGRFPLVYRDKQ